MKADIPETSTRPIRFPASIAAGYIKSIGILTVIAGAIVMIVPESEIPAPFLKGLGIAMVGGTVIASGAVIQYIFDIRSLLKWRHEQDNA